MYQNEVLKLDSAPIKERKVHFTNILDSKRSDYARVGDFLSQVDAAPPSERIINPTNLYVHRLNN